MDLLLARGNLHARSPCTWNALGDLVASYEDEHHGIGPASDAEMLVTSWKPRVSRKRI